MNPHINRVILLLAVIGISVSPGVLAQQSPAQIAQQSVESWVALVDGESYGASWDSAAQFFKNAITREKWEAALEATRKPLGRVKARSVKATTSTKTLPGAPDGEYFVFQFDASFEAKQSAVETITAVLERDGAWRVAGYFIR
jgi:hypothetical protein